MRTFFVAKVYLLHVAKTCRKMKQEMPQTTFFDFDEEKKKSCQIYKTGLWMRKFEFL